MKLILSRKGFDSENGGVPSPIFPDASLVSLPIPYARAPRRCTRLKDVKYRGTTLSTIVGQLTHDRFGPEKGVHLDPDLRRDARPRKRGWLPMFGQVDAAQTHLENQGVCLGALFLFFGSFRQTTKVGGRLVYDRKAPVRHVIFGWLQVGCVLDACQDRAGIPAWAANHPHVAHKYGVVYVATPRLKIPGLARRLPGGGVFERFSSRLCLTAPGENRSVWRLPRWFHPGVGRYPLSRHSDRKKWSVDSTGATLRTVPIGQEFVLDCEDYPETSDWLKGIFANARY